MDLEPLKKGVEAVVQIDCFKFQIINNNYYYSNLSFQNLVVTDQVIIVEYMAHLIIIIILILSFSCKLIFHKRLKYTSLALKVALS